MKRDLLPQPVACHHCTHLYAGAVCPICKEERPAYTALKKLSERQRELAERTLAAARAVC